LKESEDEESCDATTKRRSRLGIIAEMLDAAIDGVVKTRIMYKANVNFVQFNDYLECLLEAHLIRTITCRGKTIYKTTAKGRLFLHKFNKTAEMINGVTREEDNKPLIVRKTSMVYLLKK